jgi:ATP synthase protein I
VVEDHPHPSLDELDARIRKAREERAARDAAPGPAGRLPQGAFGWAMRIGVDLVAAMVVGVGGGLALDRWLGTSPWCLIVFFGLGAAAGVLNVYRAVSGLGYGPGYRRIDRNGEPRSGGGNT